MTDRDLRFAENTQTKAEQPVESVFSPIPRPQSPTFASRVQRKLGRLHLFAAFCENPINVTYETQEPDEHVLLFLRKSQWVNFPWIFTTGVLAVLPFFLPFFRGFFGSFIPSFQLLLILVLAYYIFVILYAFVNFVTWYYNAALITDKRIVDIDFHQIVLKDVAETKLALVQDVSYKQDGVFPNIFGYGFVLIQTAGTLDNFEFYNLPRPARVVEVVEGLIGGKRFYEP